MYCLCLIFNPFISLLNVAVNASLNLYGFLADLSSIIIILVKPQLITLLQSPGNSNDIVPSIFLECIRAFRRKERDELAAVQNLLDHRQSILESYLHLSRNDFTAKSLEHDLLYSLFRDAETETSTHVIELKRSPGRMGNGKVHILSERPRPSNLLRGQNRRDCLPIEHRLFGIRINSPKIHIIRPSLFSEGSLECDCRRGGGNVGSELGRLLSREHHYLITRFPVNMNPTFNYRPGVGRTLCLGDKRKNGIGDIYLLIASTRHHGKKDGGNMGNLLHSLVLHSSNPSLHSQYPRCHQELYYHKLRFQGTLE